MKTKREKFYVDWDTIGVILGDTSAIDLPNVSTRTMEKATEFLRNYGYDPDIPSQMRELEKLRMEAIRFIEGQLLQDPDNPRHKLVIPEIIIRTEDPRRLLVMASTDKTIEGRWACSVLRVMHTLTHVANDLSNAFFPAIQKQVLDRVLAYVHSDPAGDVYLGKDETGIRLYMFDIKTKKSFDSHVMKLLHKAENIGADIFDRIGFRFVTFNKLEALLVLRHLRNKIFAFPNIKTSRSRNTLIHIGAFHKELDKLKPLLHHGEISEKEALKRATEIAESDACKPVIEVGKLRERNLYSSTEFNSIQFTCRQLIRVEGPPITPMLNGQHVVGLQEYHFFFPYEIQILDRDSYHESRRGRASHAEYKRSQLRMARERVFPWLSEYHYEPNELDRVSFTG